MATLRESHDTYGQDVKLSRPVPAEMAVAERIGHLSKQVTEAGHQLEATRADYRRAVQQKERAELAFAQASEALVKALHEHREGTPDNVPYQP